MIAKLNGHFIDPKKVVYVSDTCVSAYDIWVEVYLKEIRIDNCIKVYFTREVKNLLFDALSVKDNKRHDEQKFLNDYQNPNNIGNVPMPSCMILGDYKVSDKIRDSICEFLKNGQEIGTKEMKIKL